MSLLLEDTDRWDRQDDTCVNPDPYMADINWRTAFEYGGGW